MLLTDTKLRSLKPSEKRQRVFDGDGMYLNVRLNGGKCWRFINTAIKGRIASQLHILFKHFGFVKKC